MSWGWAPVSRAASLSELVGVLNTRMALLVNTLRSIEARQSGVRRLSAGDATPSAADAAVLVTANTSATTITAIDDGQRGWSIVLVFGDAHTTVKHGTNLQLVGEADFKAEAGDVLQFRTEDGTVWRETPQPHRWS